MPQVGYQLEDALVSGPENPVECQYLNVSQTIRSLWQPPCSYRVYGGRALEGTTIGANPHQATGFSNGRLVRFLRVIKSLLWPLTPDRLVRSPWAICM